MIIFGLHWFYWILIAAVLYGLSLLLLFLARHHIISFGITINQKLKGNNVMAS